MDDCIKALMDRVEELEQLLALKIENLHFEPGDVMLVKLDKVLSTDQRELMVRRIKNSIPHGVKAIVQDPTATVRVLR